jgi:general secretion pathway protein D
MQNPWQRSAFVLACALSISLVATVSSAHAQATPVKESSSTLDIDLRDARLQEAITILAQQSGLDNVVIIDSDKANAYQKITLKLRDKSVEITLRAIARAAGATLEESDGIYYLRPAGASAPKAPEAPKVEAPVVVPIRGKGQLVKVPMTYLAPSDFVKLLDDPFYNYMVNKVIVPEALSRNMQPIAPPNIATPGGAGITGLPTEGTYSGVLGAGQRPGGGMMGGGMMGGGGGGFGGGGRQGGGLGGPGGGFGGQGGPGGGAGGQNQNQRSLRPAGIDNILASDADNTLIVQGDPADIDELKALIRLLDVAPKQVEIRAEFVTVNMQDIDNFGIQWQFSPANNLDISMAPAAGNSPTLAVQYASGNAVASLRAAYVKQTNNVLQAPIISTSNNVPASVFVTDQAWINQSVVIPGQLGGQPTIANNPIPIISSNQFLVTPHINGDGTISMFLQPQLQSFTTAIVAGTPPRQTTQGVSTFRRIKSGETMMLGGFVTKQEDGGEIRMPLLGSLPIIGGLFTQKSKTVTGVETLIFVTPRIIEEINTGGGGAIL